MNKKMEWMEILAQDKNYGEEDFAKIVTDNCYKNSTLKDKIGAELMQYRNQLLKKMDTPNFDEGITIDNLQKWFLEPINKDGLEVLKNSMQYNYWTIEDLWNVCKNESIGVFTALCQININMKFYKGMKIYNFKGQIVNILNNEAYINEINFIKNDKQFDLMEFLHDIKDTTVPIALSKQIHRIRTDRMANATDFTLSKTNIEYLSSELYSNTVYNMLIQAMKINGWSLKELVQEALRLDMNLFMISGVPNRVMA